MIPYMVAKLAPNSSYLTRGLVKYVSGRVYFRAVLSQNGDKYVTSPPPPQSLNLSGALIDSLHHASSWASWRALGGVSTAESFPLKGSRSFRLPRHQPPPRHLHQSRLYFQPPLSPKRAAVASRAWMSRLVPRSPPSRAGGPVLAFLHFVPRFCFTL